MTADTPKKSGGSIVELLSGGLWQMLAALTGLAYFPVLTRVLEADQLGAWSMLMNYALLLGVCDLGLSVAVQRVIGTGNKAHTHSAFGLCLCAITTLVPVGCFLIFLSIRHLRPEWAHLAESVRTTAPYAMASGLLQAYALPYRGFLYTQGGVRKVALAKASGATLQTVLVATGLAHHVALSFIGLAAVIASLIDLAICVVSARGYDPLLPLLPRLPARSDPFLRWLNDGLGAIVVSVFDVFASRIDVLILSKRTASGPALIGLYNYTSRLVEVPYLLTKQLLPSLTPRLVKKLERGEAVHTGTVVFTTLIMTGMCAIALDGREFMVLFLGRRLFLFHGALPMMELVLVLLGCAYVIMSTYEVASPMLTLGAHTSWVAAVPLFAGGITKYAVSYFGSPAYGVWATAGGSVLAYSVAGVWTWILTRSLLGWSWGRVLGVFKVPIIAGGLAFAVAFLLRNFSHAGWRESLFSCLVTAIVGVAAMVLAFRVSWVSQEEPRVAP